MENKLALDGDMQILSSLRLAAALLCVICLNACSQNTDTPAQSLSNPLSGAPPAVGNLNGVKIAIPREYMLFGVQYMGEDVWKPKPRTTAPSFDTPIQSFSMLLRLSDLEPIRTPQDMADYQASQHRVASPTWSIIGVSSEPDEPVINNAMEWTKIVVEHRRSPFDTEHDRNVDTTENIYGLSHSYIEHYKANPGQKLFEQRPHTYYDAKNWSGLIVCRDPLPEHVMKFHHCTQSFFNKELKAHIEVSYDIDQLPRWKDIQEKISKIVLSFVVKSPAETTH